MKTKNLFSALLAVMMIFAFSLGMAALDPVSAQAAAITVNLGEAVAPVEIEHQSILIDASADEVIGSLFASPMRCRAGSR